MSPLGPHGDTPPAGDPRATTLTHSLLRLYPLARPIVPRLALGLLTALLASGVALAIPQALQWIVNGPLFTASDPRGLWVGVAIVLALGVLEAGLLVARRQLVLAPGAKLEADLRVRLYEHLVDAPATFHEEWGSGQLLSRSISDIRRFRRWISFGLVMICVNTATIVAGIVLMTVASPVLGAVFAAAAIPVALASFHFRRGYQSASRRAQDQAGDLATTVEESVRGIRILKAFGRGRDALDAFSAQADLLRGTEIEKARSLSAVSLILTALPEAALAVALVVGAFLVAQGQLSVGAIVAYFGTAAVVSGPLGRLGEQFAMSMDAKAAIDRFFEVLDIPNTILDPREPVPLPASAQRLEFRGVTFRHPDAGAEAPEVLDGLDLVVHPGETLALVGTTGSGKSTLAHLVPRLYDVTAGQVLIGGIDVRDVTRTALRSHVSIAFEDPVLFSATVRENVLLGDPGAGDDVLEAAIDTAGAEFVRALPDGVDTVIGEEGLNLSGGQRQRISLARAIAASPRVLVLDDSLSALDVHTEEVVVRRLRAHLRDTTTIVVAHRPSTVALADRVALLDEGRITARGTHAELLATSARYRAVITSGQAEADAATLATSEMSL
jgi:ATP-binding cassette subfamily B protein